MSGIQFARIRGVPMTLHPTAIILALLAASWAFPVQSFNAVEKFVAASAAIIGVFLSILLHELGHVFAARLWNVGTTEVTLWGLGGMARLERPAPTPTAEAVISAAGPVVSITLGAIATIALNTTIGLTAPGRSLATFIFFMLAYWNVLIGVFNLLPGPPLDGGGIVRGIAWGLTGSRQKASKVAAVLGLVAAGIAIIIAISDTTVSLSFLPFEFDTAFMAVFAAFLLVFG